MIFSFYFLLDILYIFNLSEDGVKLKIGILTVNERINYGAILQTYALQTVLKKMGHEAILIVRPDLRGREMQKNYKNYLLKAQNTQLFVNKYIPQIKVKSLPELNTSNFDAIIVGSDQVWRGEMEGSAIENISSMFLDFVPKDSKCKKVAYAASFGISHWNFSPKRTEHLATLAKQFDAISVREDSGVKLCRDYLGVNALHVLDPTMLLSTEDYIQDLHILDKSPSEGKLLVYLLWHITPEKKAIIDTIALRKNWTSLFVKKYDWKFSIEQWLRGFLDTNFVVTDSFHGCVLSIVFNKPFIAFGHKLGGSERFTSLLKMFGLENRLIFSSPRMSEKLLEAAIDWEQVNKKLQELRNRSEGFLIRALKF